jgi:hypothetical protein
MPPRPEIPVMEWIERLPLSSGFRFPFIPRFARRTLRAAAEPYRKIARHLADKDQQPCSQPFRYVLDCVRSPNVPPP